MGLPVVLGLNPRRPTGTDPFSHGLNQESPADFHQSAGDFLHEPIMIQNNQAVLIIFSRFTESKTKRMVDKDQGSAYGASTVCSPDPVSLPD